MYWIPSFIVLGKIYYITPPPEDLRVWKHWIIRVRTIFWLPDALRSSSWAPRSVVTGRRSQCLPTCWRSLRRTRLGVCWEQTGAREGLCCHRPDQTGTGLETKHSFQKQDYQNESGKNKSYWDRAHTWDDLGRIKGFDWQIIDLKKHMKPVNKQIINTAILITMKSQY